MIEILTKSDLTALLEEVQKLRETLSASQKIIETQQAVILAQLTNKIEFGVEPLLLKKEGVSFMLGGVSAHVLRELTKSGKIKPVRLVKQTGEKLYSVDDVRKLISALLTDSQQCSLT